MDARYSFNPPRPLTEKELKVTRWVIEHGDASQDEKTKYLTQLEDALVVSRCACGCASVNFSIRGIVTPGGTGLQLLGDFRCDGSGVFVFSRSGLLAGIEIYQLSDTTPRTELPSPDELRKIHFDKIA
jgi:hypothetical protein